MQARDDASVRMRGRRGLPARHAFELSPAQIELPIVATATRADAQIVQTPAEHIERTGADLETRQRQRPGVDAGIELLAQREPAVEIELIDVPTDPQTATIGHAGGLAQRKQRALDNGTSSRQASLHRQPAEPAVAEQQQIGSGFGLAALDAKRHRFARRLGRRHRQIHRDPFQRGVERPVRSVRRDIERELPVGGAGQTRGKDLLRILGTQQPDVGAALGVHAHAADRTRYRQPCRTAEDLGGQRRAADFTPRKCELAIDLARERECRRRT